MSNTNTFTEQFLQHTKHYESPESFWRWSAYTAVGATLRDNAYRRMGDLKIYPNVYTLLLADSAVHRKGQPVQLCERLVRDVNSTKTISGRSSIQGILDELSRGEQDKKTGKITTGGSALWSAQELSAGIVGDPEAIKILTDIYDFRDEYTSRLRGSGIFRIKNVCFTMMAASNAELLVDLYDTKALFGGLLGRTFLVKPNEFRPANSLFSIQDTSESYGILKEKLTEIAGIKGEFEFTRDAQSAYEDWYKPFRKSYQNKSDKSGIAGRIHTSILKLAMILCVDQTVGLTVDRYHICEAIRHCMSLIPNYTSFVMSSGKSTVSDVAAQMIEDIWTSKDQKITKGEFLTRYFHQFDIDIVEKCVITLVQAGLLQEAFSSGGKDVAYAVTEKCIKVFGLKLPEPTEPDKEQPQSSTEGADGENKK